MTPGAPLLRTKYSKKVVASEIADHFATKYGRFVDAGVTDAIVFATQPRTSKRSVLTTVDPELAMILEAVQSHPREVVEAAQFLWDDLSREEYESVAASDLPGDGPAAAAQLLYLNQLSQPGTRKYDTKHKGNDFDWHLVDEWAQCLDGTKLLREEPFERFDQARPTDLVYLDTSAGVELEPALHVAQESSGKAAILASGGSDTKSPEGFERFDLSRCRPGARTPDTLYLKFA